MPADHVPFAWSARTTEPRLLERREDAAELAREEAASLRDALGCTETVAVGRTSGITMPSSPPFFFFCLGALGRAKTEKEKRELVCGLFTQGGGLGGLALGYYPAAPPGLREGEPGHFSGRGGGDRLAQKK